MAKKGKTRNLTTNSKVEQYEILSPMLDAVLTEMKELSKKKQDGVLNKLKVEMANKILVQIQELLVEEPTSQFIGPLDDATLPSNSDVVLILSQFRTAMDIFKHKYYGHDQKSYESRWFTKENP